MGEMKIASWITEQLKSSHEMYMELPWWIRGAPESKTKIPMQPLEEMIEHWAKLGLPIGPPPDD